MALQWDWNKKAGTVTQRQCDREYTLNFYEGNAFMIATYEYEEDGQQRYAMQWFFVDEEHAKRCLGQSKNAKQGRENIFSDDPVTCITLYREHCRNWQKIAALFAKAFPKIAIHILESEHVTE